MATFRDDRKRPDPEEGLPRSPEVGSVQSSKQLPEDATNVPNAIKNGSYHGAPLMDRGAALSIDRDIRSVFAGLVRSEIESAEFGGERDRRQLAKRMPPSPVVTSTTTPFVT